MTITVLSNQSFMDIAIQHTGNVYNAFSIAAANGMAISESLISGSTILIPDTVSNNEDVLAYFKSNGIRPATGTTDEALVIERRGIGWMKIGDTLKVD